MQRDLIGRIHLPNLVGLLRAAVGTCSRPAAAGCRDQPRAPEPALQRAFGREGGLGIVPAQQHAHQARAPGGGQAAQLDGLLDEGPGLRRVRSAGVRSGECVGAVVAEPLQKLSHGAGDEAQGTGNQARALTLFGPPENYLTYGYRDGMWHERSSLKPFQGAAAATCIPCVPPGQAGGWKWGGKT